MLSDLLFRIYMNEADGDGGGDSGGGGGTLLAGIDGAGGGSSDGEGGNDDGAAGGDGDSGGSPDFSAAFSQLPEDLQQNDRLKGLDSFEKLARAVADSPSAPESYELDLSYAGLSEDETKGYSEKFKELGLSQDQAAALVAHEKARYDAQVQQMTEQRAEAESAMKERLGDKWGTRVGQGLDAIEKIGGKAAREAVVNSELGNNVDFVESLVKLAEAMNDGGFHGAGKESSPTKATPEAAAKEIALLKADKEFMTKYTKGDAEARKKFDELYELAYKPNK